MRNSFLVCTAIILLNSFSFAQGNENDAIKQAFDNYKSAILNVKGEEALKYVDSKTVNYYVYALEIIKNGDSAKVDGLSLIDKITVFSVRHRATKEEIMGMDGKGLFIYAIKNGMVGKNSVANYSIGDITIDNNTAKGQLMVNGNKAPLYFHFSKEQNQWKLDLTSLFPVSNMAFKKMVTDSGEPENEYLFSLLEILTGKKPGPEIWRTIN